MMTMNVSILGELNIALHEPFLYLCMLSTVTSCDYILYCTCTVIKTFRRPLHIQYYTVKKRSIEGLYLLSNHQAYFVARTQDVDGAEEMANGAKDFVEQLMKAGEKIRYEGEL